MCQIYISLGTLTLFFLTETFQSISAEAFWCLRHFGHLSHSCINARRNSVHKPVFSDILTEMN